MKTEDIFNPDSYTSKAMPVTYELVSFLNDEAFDTVSKVIDKKRRKYGATTEQVIALYRSLNEEQQKILDGEYDSLATEISLTGKENFAKGLKLGFRLAIELLG